MKTQREPVVGSAKLELTITNQTARKAVTTVYTLRYLHPEEWANPAWKLTKADGTTYEVHLTEHGPQCTCPDFIYCRDHKDRSGCKHVAAMRAVGLLRKDV